MKITGPQVRAARAGTGGLEFNLHGFMENGGGVAAQTDHGGFERVPILRGG